MAQTGQRVATNVVWNLLGLGAPLLVAVVAIPPLVRGLGAERFGLLALAWTLIGYASLFDLGLGRALTKLVAEGLARGFERELSSAIWTSLVLLGLLGAGGSLALAAAAPALAGLLNVPAALSAEAVRAFRLVACLIPIVTLTAGLRGLLEATQRFAPLSVLRALMGVFTFLAPLLTLRWTTELGAPIAALGGVRLLSLTAHAALCLRYRNGLLADRRFDVSTAGPLFQFGGWLTVSSLLSPLLVYLDRFLIAALISVSSVAFYVTPFEIVTKLLVVPAAAAGVLFPAISATWRQAPEEATRLFRRGTAVILLGLAPLAAALILYSGPLLEWWLGSEFAARSSRVVEILAAALLINAAASMPATLLQASGRPDLTAKLHMIEFPLYLSAAVWLIRTFGIEGAAAAWAARVTLDAALLFFFAGRRAHISPGTKSWDVVHAG